MNQAPAGDDAVRHDTVPLAGDPGPAFGIGGPRAGRARGVGWLAEEPRGATIARQEMPKNS
jgi:hypothetical protein